MQFLNQSLAAYNYKWDLGDGTLTTTTNPKHFFRKSNSPYKDTTYFINLVALSPYGCRDTARGTMTARQLIVFKHQCAFGNARAQSLFDLVENNIKKPSTAPRAFSDYVFPSMDDLKTKLPTGVEAFSLTDDATIQAFIQTLT
jgi:hypothetical protein